MCQVKRSVLLYIARKLIKFANSLLLRNFMPLLPVLVELVETLGWIS